MYCVCLAKIFFFLNVVKSEFSGQQWLLYCNCKTLIAPLRLNFTLSTLRKVVLTDKYGDVLARK